MTTISGATPLAALEAVALDTETTGLDPKRARIVQIGAVALEAGRIGPASFETLVDPGLPIPPESTAIHGLDDKAIRGAPSFAEAWTAFETFRAGRIVIGHSIGFDLAVADAEHRRAGMSWQRPRSLCVRLLGALANPHLPDQSMEALGAWLAVELGQRHSAFGDAVSAARIFAALVPRLAERGIRTLAEAERACLDLSGMLESGYRAGWLEPVLRPEAPADFGNVDPYAYRHRVRELMSSPVAVADGATKLLDAIAMMTERRIGALFVGPGGAQRHHVAAYGIVTERDVMKAVASSGADALALPLSAVATRPLVTIAAGAFAYRAIGRMDRLGIRHLAVRDEADRLVGILSARDMLRLRAGAAIKLDDTIAEAADEAEMARAWAALPAMAAALMAEELDARTIAGIVSEELRVATRRAAELAEQAMLADGLGPAPCPYAVLVLGSGGRGESLLAADQDNAIVYAEGDPAGPEDRWFAELGRRFSETLDRTGIPLCKGGVMARNEAWRGSFNAWLSRVDGWIDRTSPRDLLNVDIFFDMRPVHGDQPMGNRLFEQAFRAAAARPAFAAIVAMGLQDYRSPIGLLGRVRTVDGRVDLKAAGVFPVVAAARAMAIRHGIMRRSTAGRLRGLVEQGIGNAEELTLLSEAHGFMVGLMLAQQARDLASGVPVSNRVALSELSGTDRDRLQAALRRVATVPELVRALVTS
jgi:CBS domain-containing protein